MESKTIGIALLVGLGVYFFSNQNSRTVTVPPPPPIQDQTPDNPKFIKFLRTLLLIFGAIAPLFGPGGPLEGIIKKKELEELILTPGSGLNDFSDFV